MHKEDYSQTTDQQAIVKFSFNFCTCFA